MLLAKHAQILRLASAVQLGTSPTIDAKVLVPWELIKIISITLAVLATHDVLLA